MNPIQSWQPNVDNLTQCVRLLQALRDPTRSDHVTALRSLEENVFQPNFVLHILHVFAEGYAYESSGLTIDLRQLAGLIIKNYVFPHLTQMAEEVQFLMKKELIQALHDPVPDIRNTSAILVGKISESFPINLWVSMLPPILEYLDLRYLELKPFSVDGCLLAVKRICEDSSLKLSQDDTTRPLEILVPKLLDLMTALESTIRARALESYNCLLYLLETPESIAVGGLRSRNTSFDSVGGNGGDGSRHSRSPPLLSSPTGANAGSSSTSLFSSTVAAASPLIVHMHVFISSLAQLSRDSVPLIRKLIVQGISIIACLHVALLEPFFANICEFMLASILDRGQLLDSNSKSKEEEEDESVAIEACEFWHALLQSNDTQRAMAPYLPRLIEHLIARLVLTREQMEAERQEAEEENSGAKALKIHPVHSQSRGGDNSSSRNSGGSKQQEMKDNSELSSRWTLRKQCALSLDTMAMHFPPDEVLSLALPKIQQSLASSDHVLVQESGWLALGALSQGCLHSMGPYLSQLIPILLVMVRDERLPEMKSICCWVISRLSPLFAVAASEGQGVAAVQWYVQSLVALCERIVKENEHVKVVEAGCSALCLLIDNAFPLTEDHTSEENSSSVLSEHVSMILGAINHALDKCGQKTSLLIVDIIGMLADTIKHELARPEYTPFYLPKLMDKFMSLEDDDSRVFPFLEALTSVLAVIGLEAREYVSYIYDRCLRMAQTILVTIASHKQQRSSPQRSQQFLQQVTDDGFNHDHDDYDSHESDELMKAKDFAVCAMDVLSALSEGLEQHFLELARPSRETLLQVTFLALNDIMPELRQSAFSLSGELCKYCFSGLFTPDLAKNLLELCVLNLDAQLSPFVCNNAAWTIGELALQVGGDFMRPFIGRVMSNLIVALQTVDYQDAFKVNIAVTIGRLGLVNTIEVADMADEFFAAWCSVMYYPCPIVEKTQVFTGLLNIIKLHPEILFGNKTNIYSLLVACVSWFPEPPPQEIAMELRQLLHALRGNQQQLWGRVLSTFSHSYSVDHLLRLYNL